jgi:hypothetical protein
MQFFPAKCNSSRKGLLIHSGFSLFVVALCCMGLLFSSSKPIHRERTISDMMFCAFQLYIKVSLAI